MQKIQLSYLISERRNGDALVRNPLMEMLAAVHAQGSIAQAAKVLDYSYRHVWGALKNWEKTLDRELIVWDKGQRARLTAVGEKLLWAERLAQARMAPQIETLRGDMERAFAQAFDDRVQVLSIGSSENPALLALRDQAALTGLQLDLRFMGGVDAVAALADGRCKVAVLHATRKTAVALRYAEACRTLLEPKRHTLIGFAQRRLGLMVAAGNPLDIGCLADVQRVGLRYINRAAGSRTRWLFDDLLVGAGINGRDLHGYQRLEPSHAAVAQAIASGTGDAGLGMEAAAWEKGLDFVPLVDEVEYLACLTSELASPPLQALMAALQGEAWQDKLQSLPGYRGEQITGSRYAQTAPLSEILL